MSTGSPGDLSFDWLAAAVGDVLPISLTDLTLRPEHSRRIPDMDSPARVFAKHVGDASRGTAADVPIA
jgi:hypothetical protein